jgi:lysophospholipase L1-like esterase
MSGVKRISVPSNANSNDISVPAVCRVVLMGGSSVFTGYLPQEFKHTHILQEALDRHYGAGRAEVLNWADNGLFIARYLLSGQYDRLRHPVDGVDLFIIRFGTNDAKRLSPKEFGGHLRKLLDLLGEDYPDARFILEDGIYVDFPNHYRFDRNQSLAPYWEQTHTVAAERGLAVSRFFEASEKATKAGQWDLRIRRHRDGSITLDDSKDAEHVGDVDWFTDIHPNPLGVRVAVDAEMAAVKELFPDALPTGGRKSAPLPRTPEFYSAFLGFAPEDLDKPARVNPDGFQTSVQ